MVGKKISKGVRKIIGQQSFAIHMRCHIEIIDFQGAINVIDRTNLESLFFFKKAEEVVAVSGKIPIFYSELSEHRGPTLLVIK